MQIQSSAFEQGGLIPDTYSANGENVSPPIEWSGLPQGVKSYALICEDPDAPGGIFCHWTIYNIPPDMTALPTGASSSGKLSQGIQEGKNDAGNIGWFGPKPPPGSKHKYVFRLFALSERMALPPGLRRKDVLREIAPYVMQEQQLSAKYLSH